MNSFDDAVYQKAEDQIQMLTRQIFDLKEEKFQLAAEEENLKVKIDELKKDLSSTSASIKKLWESAVTPVSPVRGTLTTLSPKPNLYLAQSNSKTSADRKLLAQIGEDHIRLQVEILCDSQSRLITVQSDIHALEKQIVEKQELIATLSSLKEDRRVLHGTKNVKERTELLKDWIKRKKQLLDDLELSSVQELAAQSTTHSTIRARKNGREPGLVDYLQFSSQRLESIIAAVFDEKLPGHALVEPELKDLVCKSLQQIGALRLEINRIAEFRLTDGNAPVTYDDKHTAN